MKNRDKMNFDGNTPQNRKSELSECQGESLGSLFAKRKVTDLKDSGIPWIGEIPKDWEISKIKYIGEARNGLTYSPQEMCDETKGTLVLRSSNIQNDNLCFEDNVYVDKEVDEELMMREGDILICSRNGSAKLVGKCAIIPKHVTATFGAFMMRFRSILNKNFSLYLIRTTLAQYKELFSTSTINQLTNTMIGNMQFPLPSEQEQQEIAEFLDRECGEIDELVALQDKMIEELKAYKQSIITETVTKGLNPNVPLKDSGIEWIGEIPQHWKVSKIKNENNILDYLRQPISADKRINELGLYDYYGASGVIDKIDDYNVDDKVLLIGEDGANLIFRNLPLIYKAEGRFWVNNHAHILKVKSYNDYTYMFYMLEAGDYFLYITGSAQPKLSQENLKNFVIPIPPLSEQQEIADFLDKKCSEIDSLIELKQQKIEELKDYKKSIIYEYVTGKKHVF